MEYFISEATALKLRWKHKIKEHEVLECFANRTHRPLADNREKHRTDPPTLWFIAETKAGRRLKVVYVERSMTEIVIRSAFEPSAIEEEIYERNEKT